MNESLRFYDMHVHPYEVMFDKFTYTGDSSLPGVLSLAGKSYTEPFIARFQFPEMNSDFIDPEPLRRARMSLIQLSRNYGNVGEQVFIDHMDLSCVDKVLLLPVAADNGDFESRMRWVTQMYGSNDRFLIGGSVPGSIDAIQLSPYISALKNDYDIKAMKCHPVVSGIDLSCRAGREWLETLLSSCHESGLPLVVHGGRNNPYWEGERGNFGSLDYLEAIDWSISEEPVILAHAGFHRCSTYEIEIELMPKLKKMLGAHPNLYIDISGLGFEQLKLVLRSVDIERILFGSDALYISQWGAMAMTMHAFKELGMPMEECLVKVASINPGKTIFKDA
jgi:predicted TIM-barrel fold metal-dependent hydrolase